MIFTLLVNFILCSIEKSKNCPKYDADWYTDPSNLYCISQFVLGSNIDLNKCKCKDVKLTMTLTPQIQQKQLLLHLKNFSHKNTENLYSKDDEYYNLFDEIINYFFLLKERIDLNSITLGINTFFDNTQFYKILFTESLYSCEQISFILTIIIKDIIEKMFLHEKNSKLYLDKKTIKDNMLKLLFSRLDSILYCTIIVNNFWHDIDNAGINDDKKEMFFIKNKKINFKFFFNAFKDILIFFLFAQDVCIEKNFLTSFKTVHLIEFVTFAKNM